MFSNLFCIKEAAHQKMDLGGSVFLMDGYVR